MVLKAAAGHCALSLSTTSVAAALEGATPKVERHASAARVKRDSVSLVFIYSSFH
jgi:hypothetical protein